MMNGTTGCRPPLCWLAIPLLMSGCSLLFSGSEASTDAGTALDGAYDARINADAAMGLGDSIRFDIKAGAEFTTFESWKTARNGDLTKRQLLLVNATGSFAITTLTGDCQGKLRPVSEVSPIVDGLLTIDLDDNSICRVGDTLTNASGDSATVLAAGPVGVRETAVIYEDMAGMVLAQDDFTTSNTTKLTISAGHAHRGMAGAGVIIRGAPTDSQFAVEIGVPHVRLIGFEITNWPASGGRSAGVNITAKNVLLDRLVVHQPTGKTLGAQDDGIFVNDADNVTVRNSFVFNVGRSGIHMGTAGTNHRLDVLGCSLANCMRGSSNTNYGCVSVGGTSHSLRLINTLAYVNQPGFVEYVAATMTSGSGSNVSSPIATASFFVNMATGDLHLSPSLDLSLTEGLYLASLGIDIDGESRPGPGAGTWLIGADHIDIPDTEPN